MKNERWPQSQVYFGQIVRITWSFAGITSIRGICQHFWDDRDKSLV